MIGGFMFGLALLIGLWVWDGGRSEIGLTDLVIFCGSGTFVGWVLA